MKKIIIASLIICIGVILGASQAHATVGGPTYIYNFKYNPADTSVYYTLQSYSGRGCPPVLYKLSLTTLQFSSVLSCDQTEKLSANEISTEIAGITEGFKDLTQINLSQNLIKIEVIALNEEKMDGDWVTKTNFQAKVYQNNALVGEFPITGCNTAQPFVFGGYAVPGLTKKIVLLLSAKSDCWEGGYTGEDFHVVGATVHDRTSASNSYKTSEALVPSEATLVVFERTRSTDIPVMTSTPSPSSPQSSPVVTTSEPASDNSQIIVALIALAFTVLGVVLGYHIKK